MKDFYMKKPFLIIFSLFILVFIIFLAWIGTNKSLVKDKTESSKKIIEKEETNTINKIKKEKKDTDIEIDYDSKNKLKLNNYTFDNIKEETKKQNYKVLVIDIDPVLTKGTIEGVSCSRKTASECLKQNKKQAINELIEDFNTSSHHNLNVVIEKTDFINEFATFKNQVTLLNGKKSYRFDEDTWLDIFRNGWYTGINDKRVQNIGNWFGTYDYEYIIKKLNLVERRNAKEFDEVWIVNVDPSLTYESIMVGKNAFWINGTPIEKDCQPFKMVNVSISRPDANFECFGHATENLLNNVFNATNYSGYNSLNWQSNSTRIDENNYYKLSLFQKFMLTDNENLNKNSGFAGVGNMHYSPNSTTDYQWNNITNKVKSKYYEWSNYPNMSNEKSSTVFNPSIYMQKNISGTKSDARLHHRWWFGLFPHHTGYTKDGYYNNWWNYYTANTYVTNIYSNDTNKTFNIGDKINTEFVIKYKNNQTKTINISNYDRNIQVENSDLFYVDRNGSLYARKKGETILKYYRDGIYGKINIKIN